MPQILHLFKCLLMEMKGPLVSLRLVVGPTLKTMQWMFNAEGPTEHVLHPFMFTTE